MCLCEPVCLKLGGHLLYLLKTLNNGPSAVQQTILVKKQSIMGELHKSLDSVCKDACTALL